MAARRATSKGKAKPRRIAARTSVTPKGLDRYRAKRDFKVTPEPAGGRQPAHVGRRFVVQEHWATRLHYDFRLELDGTLKSWAVPKGPSLDTRDKRLAIHVEDHPISYKDFEGEIPSGQYGAGRVVIWDQGTWSPVGNPRDGYRRGNLKFTLAGHKLRGAWVLVKMKSRDAKDKDAWLLIKEKDELVRSAARGELPAGAHKKKTPARLRPSLATLVDRPPANPQEWLYEVKFDGYRILTRIQGKDVRLFTRHGHDWTDRLPHLRDALESMSLKSGWLDGEIVMLTDAGTTSFQQLQNAFDSRHTADIVYFVFDLPHFNGHDLTQVTLEERRELLGSLLGQSPASIRFSETFAAPPHDLIASACKLGLEGIIGKRRDSRYSSRRSRDWIKLKCAQRQEFVIGGWTDPGGARAGFGALLLGVRHANGELAYAGKVGTGFDARTLAQVREKLEKLAATRSPFSTRVPALRAHWVKPELVAIVSFSEWTAGGQLRHAVFHGLATAEIKVSNPGRVVDKSTGITKVDVVRYYALVGELMMEHVAGRPVSMVRAPKGIGKATFFQKHAKANQMDGIGLLDEVDPDNRPYMEILSPHGLLSAAQLNVIEFHTWNATKPLFHQPDRMVFDLDPGANTSWESLQHSAQLLRTFLAQLELPAFLKTSGGKGLHVVIPIVPHLEWEPVKAFSQAIVEHMAETLPQLFVAKSGPRNRVGKVFIDYLRNGFGATTVSAWSARARPGIGISVPVAWAELPDLKSGAQWSLKTVQPRLAQGNQAWEGFRERGKSLESAMDALGAGSTKALSKTRRRHAAQARPRRPRS